MFPHEIRLAMSDVTCETFNASSLSGMVNENAFLSVADRKVASSPAFTSIASYRADRPRYS